MIWKTIWPTPSPEPGVLSSPGMRNSWRDIAKAVKEINRVFAELYQLTADEAGARRLLDELKPLIEKRRALAQKSIDLAQQN